MNTWIYKADIYCDSCGREQKDRLLFFEGSRLPGFEVKVDTGDSDDFPQGPYPDGGGEADNPQHCAECGLFLENPLTDEGRQYVREAYGRSSASVMWGEFYGITPDE
jgi:hypothetical protein